MVKDAGLERGCLQIYTGDGKGKTTAALGLALRASGRGLHVYIGQFMKGQPSGEVFALEDNPLITLVQYGEPRLLYLKDVTQEHRDMALRGLEQARTALLSGDYALVILDELNVALWFGLLDLEQVLALIDQRPDTIELVLTGRRAHEALIERADLVTEVREVKHYYSQGIAARDGIER